MDLFKPAYYRKKLDFSRRMRALEREKNVKRLRQAALDRELGDNLRSTAVRKLRDPELCEEMLMGFTAEGTFGPSKYSQKPYEAAAEVLAELGEQKRLERIFRTCNAYGIQGIVIGYIEDPALLEEAAINAGNKYGPWEYKVPETAIARIRDEATLARIALHGTRGRDAVYRINDEDLLRGIVLHSGDIETRIEAAKRMKDPGVLLEPLRKELMAEVLEKQPLRSMELLAQCGDPLCKVIMLCNYRDNSDYWKNMGLKVTQDDVLAADPEALYPIVKRMLEHYVSVTSWENPDRIPAVGWVIQTMHDNGILTERIEAELPRKMEYTYDYNYWTDEEYRHYEDMESTGTVTLW